MVSFFHDIGDILKILFYNDTAYKGLHYILVALFVSLERIAAEIDILSEVPPKQLQNVPAYRY
jgi:hypothetical protein